MVESDEGMVERGVNFAIVDHDFVETLGIRMAMVAIFNRIFQMIHLLER
jgi:hypothetical protein